MWPFEKKISSKSDCCSAMLTCDGKHHTFTGWRNIILERTVYRPWMDKPLTFDADAQERTCVICSYRERRVVGED